MYIFFRKIREVEKIEFFHDNYSTIVFISFWKFCSHLHNCDHMTNTNPHLLFYLTLAYKHFPLF